MKILVLNWQDRTNPFAGGAETHLHEIFSRIAAFGRHQVTLYCSSYPGAAQSEIVDGMRVIREGGRNMFNYYAPYRYARDFCRQGFDIVIDDVNKIPFFTPLFVREPLLAIAHHLFGKSIFLEAGVLAGSYVYGAEALLPRAYRRVPFAVVSESTRREMIAKGISPENMTVIPNCIRPDLLQTAARLQRSESNAVPLPSASSDRASQPFVIAYFGRLKRYKSAHHLIQAFARIADEFPFAEAHIIGKGDAEPELRAVAQELGLNSPEQERVRFLGYVPEERKIETLSAAYCVVNPSLKEGWGIINIEANACGAPVIAANTPGLQDSVRHGESGLLYEYGDIEALAAALRLIMNDAALHRRLRAGALNFALQFDWDNSAQQMLETMDRVIAEFKR